VLFALGSEIISGSNITDYTLAARATVVPPMEICSLRVLAMAMTSSAQQWEPCQPLTFVDRGSLDASVTLPFINIGHILSLTDRQVQLAHNSEAFFAKKKRFMTYSSVWEMLWELCVCSFVVTVFTWFFVN
jgi:hypothetical protein